EEGKRVLLAGLTTDVARLMSRMGVLDKLHDTHRFATRLEALASAADVIAAQMSQGDEGEGHLDSSA
ncbi:MAG: hypothetical protein OEU33_05430, partial [Chromatiales bacterium]|nr:hypothetical protein [Chromatiales bacterium]